MITVVVFALNEEVLLPQTIETMFNAAREAGGVELDIIIVNDGSTDQTAQVIERLKKQHANIRGIHHPVNMGPGVGAKKAIAMARFPKIMFAPGDNDLSQELLIELFLNKDRADLIMAYYLNMDDRGWFRSALSRMYTILYRLAFAIPVRYINSPCLYPTEKLRVMTIFSNRFGYSAEITVKLLRSGSSFFQVGGTRRNDAEASGSLSWKNLIEVMDVFFKLFFEIHFSRRRDFQFKPAQIKRDNAGVLNPVPPKNKTIGVRL